MWKATIRGLLARQVRLALTALAVLLGVSFVSATYVLTDTVKRSFDAVFAQTLSGVDLQVQGPRPLGDVGEPPADPGRHPRPRAGGPGRARAPRVSSPATRQFVDATARASVAGGRRRSACRGSTAVRSGWSTTA